MQFKLNYLFFQAVSFALIALAFVTLAGAQFAGDIPWD